MAKNSNLIKLGDAISQLFKQEKLDEKIAQHAIKNGWKDIVGEMVAKHTTELFFKEKILFVTINSAVVKHEMSFQKEKIIADVNKFCSTQLINTIVIR